jgi:hypothetical protein
MIHRYHLPVQLSEKEKAAESGFLIGDIFGQAQQTLLRPKSLAL